MCFSVDSVSRVHLAAATRSCTVELKLPNTLCICNIDLHAFATFRNGLKTWQSWVENVEALRESNRYETRMVPLKLLSKFEVGVWLLPVRLCQGVPEGPHGLLSC